MTAIKTLGGNVFSGVWTLTGKYMIGGTMSVDGSPAPMQRIAAFDRVNLKLIASTLSKPDGTWAISGIPNRAEKSLLVLAMDLNGNFNAEVADYITLVEMEDS